MSDALPPAGWYHDGHGLRWWSGTEWGPAAPNPVVFDTSSPEAGRNWATVADLGTIFGGFILPLVAYLTQKDRNAFARHHAAEALNFQLTLLIFQVVSVPLFLIAVFHSASTVDGPGPGFPWPIAVFFPIFLVVYIGAFVLSIIGAVKANQLVWWKYPIRIPFVSSSR